jgi:hypothetical protein
MSKFDRYDNFQNLQKPAAKKVHPIWTGIGCLLLFLIPLVAYAAADVLFDTLQGSGVRIMNFMLIPSSGYLYRIFFSIPLGANTAVRITLFHFVFVVLFCVLGFLVFSFVYAVIYRVSGPPRYGPTDAPPPKRKPKKRR